MKRILVTGAGGAPATNFVRSLRLVQDEQFRLIGCDADKYYLQRAETDERHLLPMCSDPAYLPLLKQLIAETGAELIFAQPDVEIDYGARDFNSYRRALMDFLRYRKEPRGTVVKDGRTYVKYAKVRRFGSRHKNLLGAAALTLLLAAAGAAVIVWLKEAPSEPPPIDGPGLPN